MIPISSDYRDLSNMTDEQVRLEYKSMVGRTQDSFPVKLHKIIDIIERDGLSEIVSWTSHGRAFKVHNNDRFIKEIMSKYFYQTKMASFTRQLGMCIGLRDVTFSNMYLGIYGFQKLINKENPDRGAYFHELFLRGRLGLARGILRFKHKPLLDANNEPNLELFPAMPPNPLPDKAKQAAVKKNNFPRAVHYGPKLSHIPGVHQIQVNLCASASSGMVNPSFVSSLHNNAPVQCISSNMPRNIAAFPSAPIMAVHNDMNYSSTPQTFQQTKPDVKNVPLLERIKQKRNAQNTNNSTSGLGLVQYVNGQMKPSTPISHIIMRVGHF